MPAFGSILSDDQIRAVLAYIESRWTTRELLEARAEIVRNARRQ
jgi:mono/diheme cytochrome c family protein